MTPRLRVLLLGSSLLGCVERGANEGADLGSSSVEAETETETETESETESETDTESDTETETDTETESETGADTESESETGEDTGGDEGCPDDVITYVIEEPIFVWSDAELDPLVGIECIEGELYLSDTLSSLAPLGALERVVGTLAFSDYPCPDPRLCDPDLPHVLTSLEGLEHLTEVDQLRIDAASLISLAGLDGLTTVMIFELRDADLDDVHPLAQLTEVDQLVLGSYSGEGHTGPRIAQLHGLAGLTQLERLEIVATADLVDLAGLEQLTSIGSVFIEGNDQLVDVTAVGSAQPFAGSPDLWIMDNPSLPTCNAWTLADALNVPEGFAFIAHNLPDACGD